MGIRLKRCVTGSLSSRRCATHPRVPRKYIILLTLALGVVVGDQITKYLTLRDLTTAFDGAQSPMGVFLSSAPPIGFDGYHFRSKKAYTVSENFFRLRYAENPGAAFGLFRNLPEGVRGPLFHVVSLGAVVMIGYFFSKLTGRREERWALYGLPLVLGGAIGNYIDRLARGFVIDFLEAHWFDKAAWPSFNIADMAICVGVGMLVMDSIVRKEKK